LDNQGEPVREQPVKFGRAGTLIGVVTESSQSAGTHDRPAVILLGAGIVHRVGPNRLYVKLARALAEMGFVVLRFDFGGIGDSQSADPSGPFDKNAIADTRDAMDWLSRTRQVNRFVLIAICSGAGFSFRTACLDSRVVGVAMINPAGHRWGTREERDRTLTRHYWRMISSPSFRGKNWRKLLTLRFDVRTIVTAAASRLRVRAMSTNGRELPAAEAITQGFRALLARGVRVLLVYSEGDEGLDYYELFLRERLRGIDVNGSMQLKRVPGANHTFTLLSHQRALLEIVCPWMAAGE